MLVLRIRKYASLVRREWVLLSAVILGAVLRTYQLSGQTLFGDEWHAVHTAISTGYLKILSSFGAADHSIPITLYYKLCSDTLGLSEWAIRVPFVLAGALTVLILPLLVRPLVSRSSADLFAWLLALSPTLIFYSRFARPYSITVLFGFAAAILFYRWWTTGNRLNGTLYIILTSAVGYLLLVAIPFALGPFVFFLTVTLIRRSQERRHSIRRLLGIATVTAAPLIILLATPFLADFDSLANKAGHSSIAFPVWASAFRLLTGMEWSVMVILIGLLSVLGLAQMYWRTRLFAAYLMTLSLVQIMAILMIRPVGGTAPHILARYLLVLLPVLLLFTSVGLEAIIETIGARHNKWLRTALSVILCAGFFAGGPILAVSYRPNNATGLTLMIHALFGKEYQSMLKRLPRFYKTLATHPAASLTIVEAPFHWPGDHIPLYQQVHRQTVLMGLTDNLCGKVRNVHAQKSGHGIHLETIVDLTDVQMLHNREVSFVVFHKQLQDEVRVPLPGYRHRDMSDCIVQYRLRFGAPIFEDRDIVVFSVGKV